MARKQALLFELMKEEENPPVQKGFWSQIFRKTAPAAAPETPAPQAQPDAAAGLDRNEFSPAVEAPPAPIASEDNATPETKLYLRVNTHTKAIGITLVLVIFFCGMTLGRQWGKSAGRNEEIARRSDTQLAAVKDGKPDPAVLKNLTDSPSADRPAAKRKSPAEPLTAEAKDILKNDSKITRKNGVNYLIIQVFADLADAERAQAFLAGKGVEASVEHKYYPERKTTWYVLVSANGYASLKESKQEAEAFRSQVRALGQQYRQQKDAKSYDFKTCLYARWPLK